MDENSHYGELSKEPVYRLRQILNELQVREYLYVTADTYSIVRLLPKASELMDEDGTMLMKMAERRKTDSESRKREDKDKNLGSGKGSFQRGGRGIRKLRALRMDLQRS